MDTRYLRSFLKIAETGSISRAAISLGITQPSLSQHLLRIEDEVGLKLFTRTARGVALTEGGRIFLEHARQIVQNVDQALESARQLKSDVSGQVILAMPYSISKLAGSALVREFYDKAPMIGFRLVEAFTAPIRGWLEQGKVDLGILHEHGQFRHLTATRLASEELFLVGPAGSFGSAEVPTSVTPTDISNLPLLLPGAPHGLRQFLSAEASRRGFQLHVRFDIDAMMHIPRLIAQGLGYSILPLSAISDELANGAISIARIGDGTLRRSLCLVRNHNQPITHASLRCEALTISVLGSMIKSKTWIAEPEAALL